jgi:hypothetical protein
LVAEPCEKIDATSTPPSQADLDPLLAAVAQYVALGLADHERELLNCVRIEAI